MKQGSRSIKLDVVSGYDNEDVFLFWQGRGFIKGEEIMLNWDDRKIPAIVMRKQLS